MVGYINKNNSLWMSEAMRNIYEIDDMTPLDVELLDMH